VEITVKVPDCINALIRIDQQYAALILFLIACVV